MEKYIADITVLNNDGTLNLVEIDSFKGTDFEQKIETAKFLANTNKNIKLFDSDKKMIGKLDLSPTQANQFLEEKARILAEQEEALKKDREEFESQKASKKKN